MRKRLGEILVTEGVIDAAQLQAALAEAALLGRRVGEVLVSRGECTEEQILKALAAQLGVQVAPLSTTVMVPDRLLKLVPRDFARERLVLPVFLDGRSGVLEVAMADPADMELLDELRFRTGHEIRPLVAMASEVAEAVERFYYAGGERSSAPTPVRGTPVSMLDSARATPSGSREDSSPSSPSSPSNSSGPNASGDIVLPDLPSLEMAPSNDVDTLRAEVEQLRAHLARAYAILREASAAHQVLLGMLNERGVLDREHYRRRLQERLAKLSR